MYVMAIHIEMSAEAQKKLRSNARRNQLSSIAACLSLILLSGSVLFLSIIYIDSESPAIFTPYVSPIDDAPPTKRIKIKEMSNSQPVSSVAPFVIVSSAPSNLVMATVDFPTPNIPIQNGLSFDLASAGGIGDSMSDSVGLGSSEKSGSALEGTFYDFKLTRAGAPTGIVANKQANGNFIVTNPAHLDKIANNLANIFKRNWSAASFDRYYRSKSKLYASNFFLPECSAKYAPIAYNCADKCKPAAWVVVYRGKVRAPKTGQFRFLGFGDDILAVRFNNKVVLESGYIFPSQYKKGRKEGWQAIGLLGLNASFIQTIKSGKSQAHAGYELVKHPNIPEPFKGAGFSLYAGTPFNVVQDKVYPIEILISETIGGQFKFFLFMEDMKNTKMKDGYKNYDIFRTSFALPNRKTLISELKKEKVLTPQQAAIPLPPFNIDSLIWPVVP